MNEKNFEYLKEQVKYTGFGDALENNLRVNIQKQLPEFQLSHQAKFGNDTVDATLHFKKSDQSDMYFFNRYSLKLNDKQDPNQLEHTFFLNKGNNITLKEAYNLMCGRAVNKDLNTKEGQVYNAWLQFDFKQTDINGNHKLQQFHQNYGFHLENALAKYPIKELSQGPDKSRLMESLQKGNRQSVTLMQDGKEFKLFMEANPRFKSITIYDSNLHRLGNRPLKEEKPSPTVDNKPTLKEQNKSPKQTQTTDSQENSKITSRQKKSSHKLS